MVPSATAPAQSERDPDSTGVILGALAAIYFAGSIILPVVLAFARYVEWRATRPHKNIGAVDAAPIVTSRYALSGPPAQLRGRGNVGSTFAQYQRPRPNKPLPSRRSTPIMTRIIVVSMYISLSAAPLASLTSGGPPRLSRSDLLTFHVTFRSNGTAEQANELRWTSAYKLIS